MNKRGPGSDGYQWVLHIRQSSGITEASPLGRFESYPGHSLGKSYSSAEMLSVSFVAPANLAIQYTRWWSITPRKRCKRYILQP